MHKLLNLKMTRLEFLQFLGVAVMTLFGITQLIAFLSRASGQKSGMNLGGPGRGDGFGSGGFGK